MKVGVSGLQQQGITAGKHHSLTIALHWGTALCIVLALSAVLLREVVGDQFWRRSLLAIHQQLGLMVLFGVVVRLGVRMRHELADHTGGLPKLMRIAATSLHSVLYALLIGLPALGWAATNAHNLHVRFLGIAYLPTLVSADSELADRLSDNHALAAWVLLCLVMVHTVAALYHHLVRGDRVLWAMLPEGATREAQLARTRRVIFWNPFRKWQ
jgi:cytochrome b561